MLYMTATSQPKKHYMTPSLQLLGPNFNLIKQHYLPIIYLVLIPGLVTSLGMALLSTIFDPKSVVGFRTPLFPLTDRETIGAILATIGTLWALVNIGPATYLQLQVIDTNKQLTLRQYYKNGLRYTLPLIGLNFVFGLALLLGLLLFIIPAVFVLRRYFLAQYYLIDKKLSVMQALKQSAKDSKQYSGAIWGVIGVLILFQLAAVLLQSIPLLGIIWAELVAYAAIFIIALRYREIQPKVAARKSTTKNTKKAKSA